jgi:signal transduction histidine kinase
LFYLDGETRASWEELPLTRAIRSGETITDEEWVLEDKEGRKSYALFNAGPIRDREDAVTGGIAVWRDITKRRSAEAELFAAKERLIRQEKLAYLGALAGGVGHELRTPLGSIKNAAYFLKMVVDDPSPEVKEALAILEREVDTTENIITALLDFARPHQPERRRVELNTLLEETIAKLDVSSAIDISWSLGPLDPVSADPGQLRQVLGNISANAIQAMPDGGQLSVETGMVSPKEVYVSITDTGPGIEKDHLSELFEPLFTTKARGIGLGLSVAQTLVHRHGGVIEVESTPGHGSTFTIRLPLTGPEEG